MDNKKKLTASGVTRIDTGLASHRDAALASGGDRIAIEHAGRLHVVGGRPFVIGRSPTSDLVIDHAAVSRRHARLVRTAGGYFIEDLSSRNGVRLDGQPVRGSARLIPGMVLTLGDVSVVVRTARRSASQAPWLGLDAEERSRRGIEDTSPMDGLLLFMTTVDEALLKGETRERQIGRAHV